MHDIDKGVRALIQTRVCTLCGDIGHVEMTAEQLDAYNLYDLPSWREGSTANQPIQVALACFDAGIREQIKTGIHPECWAQAFAFDMGDLDDIDDLED